MADLLKLPIRSFAKPFHASLAMYSADAGGEQTDTEKSKKSFVQVKEESLNAEESLILNELSFELQAKLKIALEKISEEEKELINLRFYQGLSFEEIAQELNKTQNYCLVKFHRLKDKLKKMMK